MISIKIADASQNITVLNVENPNELSLAMLQRRFPGSLGLEFANPSGTLMSVTLTGGNFSAPAGGWSDNIYRIVMPNGATAGPSSVVTKKSFPMKLSEVRHFVTNEEGKETLRKQFSSISTGRRWLCTACTKIENRIKNRHRNIGCYDASRVHLTILKGDESSDYIHANYIDGYHQEKEYVATQGPLPNTVKDFWRMIWELKSHKIISLANVLENRKVKFEQFWPVKEMNYGFVIVNKIEEKEFQDHVVRTLRIRKVGHLQSRVIRQFHFMSWKDMDIPKDHLSLVAMTKQVRKFLPEDTAPIVVHCSAGVGRTGTLILLDSCLQEAVNNSEVDVVKRLDHIRDQRMNVVEKEEQFIMVYQAINDLFYKEGSQEYLKKFEDWYDQEFPLSSENIAE